MKKTVFLFPGQGSQAVGTGQDFYQEFDFVKEIFDMAE
ncbi:MAG: malonyl CoA-acyl carrier protein transacylase, partial [Desulfobacteraceae bacterium]|nr:malonyl CoA-acyl carrier protein transacylase [Desulfobacteraceae bacterium]